MRVAVKTNSLAVGFLLQSPQIVTGRNSTPPEVVEEQVPSNRKKHSHVVYS